MRVCVFTLHPSRATAIACADFSRTCYFRRGRDQPPIETRIYKTNGSNRTALPRHTIADIKRRLLFLIPGNFEGEDEKILKKIAAGTKTAISRNGEKVLSSIRRLYRGARTEEERKNDRA